LFFASIITLIVHYGYGTEFLLHTYVVGTTFMLLHDVTVNAADNKQRDPKGMTTIKIDIDP